MALVVGTAGHIDHGKTSLVRALTGVDCDTLPQEKLRGISIEAGYASMPLPEMTLSALSRCLGDDGLIKDESSPELMFVRGELRRGCRKRKEAVDASVAVAA